MPEYLAPGVFVEEVSFRSRTIEGVPTSTTGFVGMSRYGPVHYLMSDGLSFGPSATEARLVTSFSDYERAFGGLERLTLDSGERDGFLAHSARAFFANGGSRLYVARVFRPLDTDNGVAFQPLAVGADSATWRARWPGSLGNALVTVTATRTKNVALVKNGAVQAQGAGAGTVVEVLDPPPSPPLRDDADVDPSKLAVVLVDQDQQQTFAFQSGVAAIAPTAVVHIVELRVTVSVGVDRIDVYDGLGAHPDHQRFIGRMLAKNDPMDEDAAVWLDWTPPAADPAGDQTSGACALIEALQKNPKPRLEHGNDGKRVVVADITGRDANPDVAEEKATGLCALGEVTDIAIVAAPDSGAMGTESDEAVGELVAHAERMRYRIAIADPPPNQSMSQVRAFRGRFDSTRAAMYHPWIEILDPLKATIPGTPAPTIALPPCGFVAGIYARSDVNRGVGKAPANEIVQGLSRFEQNINTARQQVLNPAGINGLRYFAGRGSRVWGARTMSSDPEWKYVNVRRLFIYLEHSIDAAMQWAVFEPNNDRLWASVRASVEDFLYVEWKNGNLLGSKPEEAFFVRCDRTTMSQNDLDNGRLICLIGVAPVKPAEFVIFRIGQWTADSTLV